MVHRWGAKNSDHAFMGCVQSGGEFGKREINKENRVREKIFRDGVFRQVDPQKQNIQGKRDVAFAKLRHLICDLTVCTGM